VRLTEASMMNCCSSFRRIRLHDERPADESRNGFQANSLRQQNRELRNRSLAVSEGERNAAFTRLLQESNAKCDRVIRTLFRGTALGLDDWEVLCRDRNSYSLTIMLTPELDASIEFASCRELAATTKRLSHGAGSKSKAAGCRIK
jgi:hypothetical protein